MSRVFVAAPFDGWMNSDRSALAHERQTELLALIELLEGLGYEVLNSHRREAFGADWMGPDECTPLDYEGILSADCVVAIPGFPASGGVHVEIGWASALGKRLILLLETSGRYSNLVEGLEGIRKATCIRYRGPEEYRTALRSLLSRSSPTDVASLQSFLAR